MRPSLGIAAIVSAVPDRRWRRVKLFMRREHNTEATLPDDACIAHDGVVSNYWIELREALSKS